MKSKVLTSLHDRKDFIQMMNGFAAAPKLLYSADYYKDKKNGWKTEDVLKKVGKAKKTVLLIKTDRG